MNWQHLRAFVWLRWRLTANQWRRAGRLNAVLTMCFAVAALVAAIPLFIGSLALGLSLIPGAEPAYLLYAWDGLVIAFLFFWSVGLVTELQRTDSLTLSKFLHLPVSVNGAFLINYVSSLGRLSLVVFGPIMAGFCLALVVVKGATLLPALPLLAAFFLMITALTYQLQGWLGALMSNPRRRRTVVVTITALFVLTFQLPNLMNLYSPWGMNRRVEQSNALVDEFAKLDRAEKAGEFDAVEHLRRQEAAMQKSKLAMQQADRDSLAQLERGARLVNLVVPVGWLPLGVTAAAEGRLGPSLLCLAGMSLIGAASLRRAYRSTVLQYQGEASNPKPRPVASTPTTATTARRTRRAMLMEARLPGVSEPAAAVALGGFRALLRAPEAKMMLLTPLIMAAVFGSMLWRNRHNIPESFRPMIAISGMGFVLLGVIQMSGNQFGIDRDGFRAYVLSAAPRREILLGKNLVFAPLVAVMGLILLVAIEVVCPLRPDHAFAIIPQYISMFLIFCVVTNLLSIVAPLHLATGSLKATNMNFTTGLIQLIMVLVVFPLAQGVTLLPLGAEALLEFLGKTRGIPVFLVTSLLECVAVVIFYRLCLGWQGKMLQNREQRILECVTNRAA